MDHLTTELISDPRLWRLAIELRQRSVEVVILSMLQDNSLIRRSLPLDPNKPFLTALTDAVYSNPLVLSDFGKVDILIDTERFTMAPAEIESEETQQKIMHVLWPKAGYTVLADNISNCDDQLLLGVGTDLLAFVRRTFPTSRVMHRLTPIIRYFYNKDRLGSTSKMYVQLQNESIDVVSIANGKLKVVNTFSAPTVDDMVYYILAVAKTSGFDIATDEVMLYGLQNVRDAVMPQLRKYVHRVIPVLFPSTLLAMGKEAMTTPFELIILPLCE